MRTLAEIDASIDYNTGILNEARATYTANGHLQGALYTVRVAEEMLEQLRAERAEVLSLERPDPIKA